MKPSRQQQVARVERFASLWERLVNLFLDKEEFDDVSTAKEEEFLSLQGSIMQELAAVAELEEGRFALIDEVTSVINEAVSIRHMKGQSEFQARRRKERGRQVAELIEKVKRFVADRDSAALRKEREVEVRLSRPFWDPEKGKFQVILGRIVGSPVRFFSAMRVAGETRKANSFLLTLLSILMLGCVVTIVAFNAATARAISYNFTLESGILTDDGTLAAKIIIWVFVLIGIVIVSLAGAIAAAILAQILTLLMHIGFKVAGAKADMVASHKVVVFGLTPLLLLILLPIVGYMVKRAEVSPLLPLMLPAVTLCCVAVLQVIGVAKVHSTSAAAGIIGWLIGFVLFAVVTLASLWVWHYSLDALPPTSGKYVFVTAMETHLHKGKQRDRIFPKGEILTFIGEEGDFYKVRSGKEEGRIKKDDAQVREGSIWTLPVFLVESSGARAEVLIHRLSRKIEEEAR